MIERLYEKYYIELHNYLKKHTLDYAHAEDIVQEVFLRAIEHEDVLEWLGEKQQRGWLYRTAKNLLIDDIRHRKREPQWGKAERFEEDFSRVEVQQFLGILSEKDKAIWQLRYFEGYHASEIAEIFDMKPDNVRARLSLMRKLLKTEL